MKTQRIIFLGVNLVTRTDDVKKKALIFKIVVPFWVFPCSALWYRCHFLLLILFPLFCFFFVFVFILGVGGEYCFYQSLFLRDQSKVQTHYYCLRAFFESPVFSWFLHGEVYSSAGFYVQCCSYGSRRGKMYRQPQLTTNLLRTYLTLQTGYLFIACHTGVSVYANLLPRWAFEVLTTLNY